MCEAIGLGMSRLYHQKEGGGDSLLHPLHIIQRVRCSFEGRTNNAIVCWPAVDWLIATLFSGLALKLGNIKGTDLRGTGHLPELVLNSRWINTIATGFQQQRHRSATFTNLQCCAFHECCAFHCWASSSAPFTNLQCYAFHRCCTHHHYCTSTVSPFYGVAPFVSYYFVPCDHATRQFYITNNISTDVNTPCRLFNCIVEI